MGRRKTKGEAKRRLGKTRIDISTTMEAFKRNASLKMNENFYFLFFMAGLLPRSSL